MRDAQPYCDKLMDQQKASRVFSETRDASPAWEERSQQTATMSMKDVVDNFIKHEIFKKLQQEKEDHGIRYPSHLKSYKQRVTKIREILRNIKGDEFDEPEEPVSPYRSFTFISQVPVRVESEVFIPGLVTPKSKFVKNKQKQKVTPMVATSKIVRLKSKISSDKLEVLRQKKKLKNLNCFKRGSRISSLDDVPYLSRETTNPVSPSNRNRIGVLVKDSI
jgi:hypothetical protein